MHVRSFGWVKYSVCWGVELKLMSSSLDSASTIQRAHIAPLLIVRSFADGASFAKKYPSNNRYRDKHNDPGSDKSVGVEVRLDCTPILTECGASVEQ
jgi:hypothetical protein